MKRKIFDLCLTIMLGIILFSSSIIVLAVPDAPPGEAPGGMGGPGGGIDASSVTHTGASTLTSGSLDNQTYTSSTGGENALLISSGTVTLKNPTITKSGDESSESADFYGTNAAVFAYNSGILNITGGTVTTTGAHANGVFAYDTGTINITNTKINTSNNNSGGIMVTGGGTLNATNLTIETKGNSSAAIRSDRGGGTLTVKKGIYKTTGVGSPAIYSTANIIVNNATLTSTASEGVVVEGANSVSLEKVKLEDTNTTLNGNSETYKNIFLYQSMSGDADEGNASFSSKDSTIKTNKGDTIFVTNTTATISLENNNITNKDGDFLRIQTGKWGNSGSNGGNVTLNMTNQKVDGNIIVDNISTLSMNLTEKTIYKGIINTENTASNLSLKLDKDSVIVLNGDSYINSLENEDSTNMNIYLNKHKLVVNGKEISGNTGTYREKTKSTSKTTKKATKKEEDILSKYLPLVYIFGGLTLLGLFIIMIVAINNKKNNKIF